MLGFLLNAPAYLKKAFGAEDLAAWVLVAVTIIAAYIAIRTLRAIEHEATIAAKIASAANKNVDAVLDSERAWISARIGEFPDFIQELAQSQSSVGFIWILPTLQNYGKTPARLKKIRAKVQYLEPDKVPAQPNYEAANYSFDNDILLVPATGIQLFSIGISPMEWQPVLHHIMNGIVQVYVYGYVDYVDVSNRQFQTRFCFVYRQQAGYSPQPSGFYMGGPPAYNQAT